MDGVSSVIADSGMLHLPRDSSVWLAASPGALTRALLEEGCCEENCDAWVVPILQEWRRVPPHTRRALTTCHHALAAAAALRPDSVQLACVAACTHGAANFVRAVNTLRAGALSVHSRRGVFSCAFAAGACDTADGMRAFMHVCATSPRCKANAPVLCRFASVLASQWGAHAPKETCSALMTVCCTPHFLAAGLPCMNALVRLLHHNRGLARRVQRVLHTHDPTAHITMASAVNTRVLQDALRGDDTSAPVAHDLPVGWSPEEHAAAVAAARASS